MVLVLGQDVGQILVHGIREEEDLNAPTARGLDEGRASSGLGVLRGNEEDVFLARAHALDVLIEADELAVALGGLEAVTGPTHHPTQQKGKAGGQAKGCIILPEGEKTVNGEHASYRPKQLGQAELIRGILDDANLDTRECNAN